MNSIQAKLLSLPEIMSRMGYEPVKVRKEGYEYWYTSPFRKEAEPSFHTSFLGGKWIWNDFGDIGGTVIDFVMRHEGYNRVGDALQFLDEMFGKTASVHNKKIQRSFLFKQQPTIKQDVETSNELIFFNSKPISNPYIESYLINNRKIPQELLSRYLKEISYRNKKTGKEYFAFGMKNESGGYEIRVASDQYTFKSSLIKKDISLIKGKQVGNNEVNLFEGMLDFLSMLALVNSEELQEDSIIMHSLTSYSRVVEIIKENAYSTINLFLDNNSSGKKTTKRFAQDFPKKTIDNSHMFASYEDLNDMLKARSVTRF